MKSALFLQPLANCTACNMQTGVQITAFIVELGRKQNIYKTESLVYLHQKHLQITIGGMLFLILRY